MHQVGFSWPVDCHFGSDNSGLWKGMKAAVLAVPLSDSSRLSIEGSLEDGSLSRISAGEIEHLGVRRPRKLIHPILKLRHHIFDPHRRAVIEYQPEFIALIATAGLRAPGYVLSIGRVGRVEVAARRDADRYRLRRRIGQVEGEDFCAD